MYNVFLVDDEPILLEGIRSKIDWESIGLNFVGEATDGEIALSMMQELKPDILITDVKMPFMDGLELSCAIKKIQPWIKIIILVMQDSFREKRLPFLRNVWSLRAEYSRESASCRRSNIADP